MDSVFRRLHLARQRLQLVCAFTPLLLVPPVAGAQTGEGEIAVLREEVSGLRRELAALRAEFQNMTERGNTGRPNDGPEESSGATSTREPSPVGPNQSLQNHPLLGLLETQIDELAQTKVESNSRMPVRFFGTILSSTFFNSGEANWLDIPNVVPPDRTSPSKGSFSSNLRQSRLGAIIDGPEVGSFQTSGFLAMDFFGGVPGFKTGQTMGIPRLLYAFMRLDGPTTAFEIGQDLMILAPRNPTSLAAFSFPNLFYSGNLYLRVPQARVEQVFGRGRKNEVELQLGIVAPVSGDLPTDSFTFVPPNLPGEKSRRPAVQARVAWRRTGGIPGEPVFELGASGHYGSERRTGRSPSSWVGSLDFMARSRHVGVQGEFWVGQNIDAFGASIGQLAKSRGGFFEGTYITNDRLAFHAGFGIDSLFDRVAFPAPLTENATFFANTIYQFTPEFATSLEWRRLMTTPSTGTRRINNHFNMVFAYSF